MQIHFSSKFPKLSSDSPANRLKSLSPIQKLSKSRNTFSLNSGKLLIVQKSKVFDQDSSLASKYFIQEPSHSLTPKSSEVSQSLEFSKSKSNKKSSLFQNLNSWLITEELQLLQNKNRIENLPDLQNEFQLYKDYLLKLVFILPESSKDFRTCHSKAVEKIVQIFGKVLRRSAQNTSIIPQTEPKPKKILKSSFSQTENESFDFSDDFENLEVLKSASERLKNMNLENIIDKLFDIKQSIIDMHSMVPIQSEKPEVSSETYRHLLKMVWLKSNSKEKQNFGAQTENNEEKQQIQDLKIVIDNTIKDFDKIQIENEQLKEQIEKDELNSAKVLQEFDGFTKGMEKLEKALFESMKKLEIIQEYWIKASGVEFDFDELHKNLIGFNNQFTNIEKHDESPANLISNKKIKEIQNNNDSERHIKECKICKNHLKSKLSPDLSAGLQDHSFFEVEQHFISHLSDSQLSLFQIYKSTQPLLSNNQSLLILSKSCKSTQTSSRLSKVQKFLLADSSCENESSKYTQIKNPEQIESSLQTLSQNPEGRLFMTKLLGNSEFFPLPHIFKCQLISLLTSHLSKKCIGDCWHLKRAMMLKKIHLLPSFPLKKIQI